MPLAKPINFTVKTYHLDVRNKLVIASATCSRADRPKMFGARVAMELGKDDLGWVREMPKMIGHREKVLTAHGIDVVWVTVDINMVRQDGEAGASERGIERFQRFKAALVAAGYHIEWQYHRPGYQTCADFERCLRPANLIEKPRAYAD